MKRKQKPLACLLLTLALAFTAPSIVVAELKLPQTADDYRQLTQKETNASCALCGVVTDVSSASRQADGRRSSAAATPVAGIGNDVATTPLVGSGSSVKDARNAQKPVTYYKIIVRYLDGSYAYFEQDEQPAVRKGDAVEVVDGRVVGRAAE